MKTSWRMVLTMRRMGGGLTMMIWMVSLTDLMPCHVWGGGRVGLACL